VLDAGVEHGVIERSGSHLTFGGAHIGNGRDKCREALAGNPPLLTKLRDAVRAARPTQRSTATAEAP
jgi:recombination protein RecA